MKIDSKISVSFVLENISQRKMEIRKSKLISVNKFYVWFFPAD